LKINPVRALFPAVFVAFLLSIPFHGVAQKSNSHKVVEFQMSKTNAKFGVAWKYLANGDTGMVNGTKRFPMQSVYKFPLAMAVLNQVDQGKLSLDQKVRVTPEDYSANTWSPMMTRYPEANMDLPLSEIIMYTVTHSDNVACDILFRIMGGPKNVEKYVRKLGVRDMAIRYTEEEMHEKWDVQFKNWCEPHAMLRLLEIFHEGKALTSESNGLLRKMMEETTTGTKRIKGRLPSEVVVAHRTGFSGRDATGKVAAVNDVGIIRFPDGSHLLLVVYITDSAESDADLEGAIANIANGLYNYYK
jgi:beta-lactamase class A